jgi:hypothetical protein
MSEHYQIKVSLQFFAPHHGFTLCDAHFGSGKLKLRNNYIHRTIRTTQKIAKVFQQIANTTVIFLEKISVREKLKVACSCFIEIEENEVSNNFSKNGPNVKMILISIIIL